MMSIWKELYDAFDKERSRWEKTSSDKQSLAFEIQRNLTFIADALHDKIDQKTIIKGLEHDVFDKAIKDGFNFNSIKKGKLTKNTIGGFSEFKKYAGKDTAYLVKNSYSKMSSLSKLVSVNNDKDYSLKIKSLFRFFVLLVTHIEGRHLTSSSSGRKKHAA